MPRWSDGLARLALGASMIFISSFDDSNSDSGDSNSDGSDSGSSDSGGSSGSGDTGSSVLSSSDDNRTDTGWSGRRRRRGAMPVRDIGQPNPDVLTDQDYGDIPRG